MYILHLWLCTLLHDTARMCYAATVKLSRQLSLSLPAASGSALTIQCLQWLQSADFGPRTALKIVDAIRDDIRSGKVKTKDDVRSVDIELMSILT